MYKTIRITGGGGVRGGGVNAYIAVPTDEDEYDTVDSLVTDKMETLYCEINRKVISQ